MKPSLSFLLLLLGAVLARADVVIVQTIDGMAQSGTMTMTVGADKIRTDIGPGMSSIVDTASGDTTTIMQAQQSYMVMPAATMKAMAAQGMAMAAQQTGTTSSNPATPLATGKRDKINGYDASEYTYSNGNIKATYWICENYPNGQMIKDALTKFQKSSFASMIKGMTPDLTTLPGIPIKTEVLVNGQKLTTTLVSATEQTVDPSVYQVPAGYNEIKMPAMPGALGPQ